MNFFKNNSSQYAQNFACCEKLQQKNITQQIILVVTFYLKRMRRCLPMTQDGFQTVQDKNPLFKIILHDLGTLLHTILKTRHLKNKLAEERSYFWLQ